MDLVFPITNLTVLSFSLKINPEQSELFMPRPSIFRLRPLVSAGVFTLPCIQIRFCICAVGWHGRRKSEQEEQDEQEREE